MLSDVFVTWLWALPLGGLVALTAQRCSVRLMQEAVLVYGAPSHCPKMRGAYVWFAVWYVVNIAGLTTVVPGSAFALAPWVLWLAVLGLLGLIDANTGLLPNELNLLMMIAGLAWHAMTNDTWLPAANYAWGMVLGWLLPWLLNDLHERWRGTLAIGQGDAKLLAGIGAWLGLQSLPLVWVIACLAMLVYTALVVLAGHGRPAYVTFGPFLAVGASTVMLLNHV
ncbi:prepilin peptidase [Orrella daihaiensis]|uniref:Prepilin peptidase n=1 Tax=Orrella daihaiensis TaxID=2782176 RepID=A0ABY4AIT4_9BURK|nr:A24 family peptidase [Orrella daihaiensis]UOD50204.1 prepilin peptidase [Orrella daihaiensis]